MAKAQPRAWAQNLLDKYASDTKFRAAMQKDPAAALQSSGIRLTTEQRDIIGIIDWSQPPATDVLRREVQHYVQTGKLPPGTW